MTCCTKERERYQRNTSSVCNKTEELREILGFHGREDGDDDIVGSGALLTRRLMAAFWRNILPLSSDLQPSTLKLEINFLKRWLLPTGQ